MSGRQTMSLWPAIPRPKLVDQIGQLSPFWDSRFSRRVRVCAMRTGKPMSVSPADRRRLQALIKDRNAGRKHVWGAEIVLFTADGVGTNEIMRRTGKSKDLRLALARTVH